MDPFTIVNVGRCNDGWYNWKHYPNNVFLILKVYDDGELW